MALGERLAHHTRQDYTSTNPNTDPNPDANRQDYKRAQKNPETARMQSTDIDFRNPTPEQIADAKKHGIE